MDLADLEIFVAVARRGNFAAVAKERDLDPSSVSRSIAKLEGVLGLRLLQRTTRRVTLTEAGDIYLARIEPMVEELVGAQEAAAGTSAAPRGTLPHRLGHIRSDADCAAIGGAARVVLRS